LLLAAIVGSGIMAQRLDGGNVAIALLANAIVASGVLVAIIWPSGPFPVRIRYRRRFVFTTIMRRSSARFGTGPPRPIEVLAG